jgi:hypothetical protein
MLSDSMFEAADALHSFKSHGNPAVRALHNECAALQATLDIDPARQEEVERRWLSGAVRRRHNCAAGSQLDIP